MPVLLYEPVPPVGCQMKEVATADMHLGRCAFRMKNGVASGHFLFCDGGHHLLLHHRYEGRLQIGVIAVQDNHPVLAEHHVHPMAHRIGQIRLSNAGQLLGNGTGSAHMLGPVRKHGWQPSCGHSAHRALSIPLGGPKPASRRHPTPC